MNIQRKFITTLFDEKIDEIGSGRIYLGIHQKDIVISVSGVFNKKPFHELLTLLKNINNDYIGKGWSKEVGNFYCASNDVSHSLYFDEEGDGTRIFFSHHYDNSEQQFLNIDVISNASGEEPEVFLYTIKRKDLFTNVFDLIEQNLEAYNLDCKRMFRWDNNGDYVNVCSEEFCATIQTRGEILEQDPRAFDNTIEPIKGEGSYGYFQPLDKKEYLKIKKEILKNLNKK